MTQLTEKDLQGLTKSFKTFLKGSNGKFIVFDLETNGFHGSSVLSISAQKFYLLRGKKIVSFGEYHRYYFPIEQYNWAAVKVNGLNKKTVIEKRGDSKYALHFEDDLEDFRDWCEDIQHFVGHNIIKFDCSFFPSDFPFTHVYDTMKETTDICKMPPTGSYGGFKSPKLAEAASFFDVDTTTGVLHTSSFDVAVTANLFGKLYSLI